MAEGGVTRVSAEGSPTGAMGQRYLASGSDVSMRLWAGEPHADATPQVARDYETVGYVVSGRARVHAGGQALDLGPGDSWLVPRGVMHTYEVLEPFTAVEATSPPAQEQGRDAPA